MLSPIEEAVVLFLFVAPSGVGAILLLKRYSYGLFLLCFIPLTIFLILNGQWTVAIEPTGWFWLIIFYLCVFALAGMTFLLKKRPGWR